MQKQTINIKDRDVSSGNVAIVKIPYNSFISHFLFSIIFFILLNNFVPPSDEGESRGIYFVICSPPPLGREISRIREEKREENGKKGLQGKIRGEKKGKNGEKGSKIVV